MNAKIHFENVTNATHTSRNTPNTLVSIKTTKKTKRKFAKCKNVEHDYSPEAVKRILRIAEETEAEFLAGKIRSYSADEFYEAVENGKI